LLPIHPSDLLQNEQRLLYHHIFQDILFEKKHMYIIVVLP